MPKRIAVVDGANIAYVERSRQGDPKISNLLAVRAALEKKGYEPLIIVDASLIYRIDDRPQLEALIQDQMPGDRERRTCCRYRRDDFAPGGHWLSSLLLKT